MDMGVHDRGGGHTSRVAAAENGAGLAGPEEVIGAEQTVAGLGSRSQGGGVSEDPGGLPSGSG